MKKLLTTALLNWLGIILVPLTPVFIIVCLVVEVITLFLIILAILVQFILGVRENLDADIQTPDWADNLVIPVFGPTTALWEDWYLPLRAKILRRLK